MTNAIHQVFARKATHTDDRSLVASVTVLAMIATLWAAEVTAQPRGGSVPRTQAAAEGASGWKADNCWYVFQGGRWRSQDLCRVMRGPAVYDTYRPSTKTWLARIDESDPGWTMTKALNNPNAMWFKYRTVGGRNLLILVNNQWVDAAGWIAQQPKTAPPNPAPQAPLAYCQPFRGPFIAANVRESIPNNPSCRTAEEKAWHRQMTANIQNGWILNQQRRNCENGQHSQPYVSSRKGPDGVMVYTLSDGSQARPGGSLNQGWQWTPTGPQPTACF